MKKGDLASLIGTGHLYSDRMWIEIGLPEHDPNLTSVRKGDFCIVLRVGHFNATYNGHTENEEIVKVLTPRGVGWLYVKHCLEE